MKKAFTILELVFVIVILGILAAIALPKLSSSKDDTEVSKSLTNLRTAISDITQFALKNDSLTQVSLMSNVSGLENIDLSTINSIQDVKFRVGNDDECLNFIFVDKSNLLLFGISSNDTIKALIKNIADLRNEALLKPNDSAIKANLNNANNALLNANFTSTSANKACVNLTNSQSFKDLANKVYILLGN